MAHIALPEGLPGITGGFAFRPETAKPMRELAHVLLQAAAESSFSRPCGTKFANPGSHTRSNAPSQLFLLALIAPHGRRSSAAPS